MSCSGGGRIKKKSASNTICKSGETGSGGGSGSGDHRCLSIVRVNYSGKSGRYSSCDGCCAKIIYRFGGFNQFYGNRGGGYVSTCVVVVVVKR
jgi:hypothetical protein